MKAYIGDESAGTAVVLGVERGEVKVASSVRLEGQKIKDPRIVEKDSRLSFKHGIPPGWRRAPEYDDYVENLYFERFKGA